MVAGVAEGCVIGVDLGGTKLWRAPWTASGRSITVPTVPLGLDQWSSSRWSRTRSRGVRRRRRDVEAVGFGIPCTFDARTGLAVQAVNLPLHASASRT